jgi:type I restriction enzyme S subunit
VSFPRYPKYKDSGVDWLGEVPAHWQVNPLKVAFQIVGGATPKSENEVFWEGSVCWATPADLSGRTSIYIDDTQRKISSAGLESCAATLVPSNSIILSTRAPIGSLAITAREMCTNQGCKALIPSSVTDAKYFAYLLSVSSKELNQKGKGTTFLELSGDALGVFKTSAPPLIEQRAIATFLDWETAKIDVLVAEQQRLIELLKEKRQAVISHAVTKGLNSNAQMKCSGISWLGDVPAHWEIRRIKHLVKSIEQGWSPQCEGYPVESDIEWGVLKVGCVNGGVFEPTQNKALPADLEPLPALGISEGDVLISRANTRELVGGAAVASRSYPRLMLCDKLYRLLVTGDVNPRFMTLYLGSSVARSRIELDATGASSSMVNIGQGSILELEMPTPDKAEQNAIVIALDEEMKVLERLEIEAGRAICLLQERRTALISAAVTGKIDVRHLADAEAA